MQSQTIKLLEKRVRVSTLSVLVMAALISASPIASADAKIGFVNSEKIMRESAPAKRADQRMEKDFAPRNQELQRMSRDLEALQKKLEGAAAAKLPEADRRKIERDLGELNRDFQRKQREYGEDVNQRRNEELTAVLDKVNRAIKQIAESEQYDVILQDAVYANPKLDITEKIIKALAADGK